MKSRVGLAIFSQSAVIAWGTANIVRDLVGEDVLCVHYGREPSGRLEDMIAGMKIVLSDLSAADGIVVLVDVGATEIAAETAIESLPERVRHKVRICDAPIVEGAIIVGTEAARGSSLIEVCTRAETLSRPRHLLAC